VKKNQALDNCPASRAILQPPQTSEAQQETVLILMVGALGKTLAKHSSLQLPALKTPSKEEGAQHGSTSQPHKMERTTKSQLAKPHG